MCQVAAVMPNAQLGAIRAPERSAVSCQPGNPGEPHCGCLSRPPEEECEIEPETASGQSRRRRP